MTTTDRVADVTKTLEMAAEPAAVWEAITQPAALGSWFPDRVEIEDMTPGTRGWFVWEQHGRYAFEIVDVEEGRRLVWRWAQDADKELEETGTTLVEWVLEPRPGGGTMLRLRESGFPTAEYRGGNDEGWDKELGHLLGYVTQHHAG
jgi:uncharacterized protein YndB with AHSA1/START domain